MRANSKLAVALFGALIAWMTPASAVPLVGNYLNPDWADADKLNSQGDWGWNYWDDADNDGHWDKTENFADAIDGSWANGRGAKDLSCWIASAANMLASAGLGDRNAQNIYWDMIYNMAMPYHAGGWQYGGWQHEALNWYLGNRPHEAMFEVSYYGVYYGKDRDGTTAQVWPTAPFDEAADFLASAYDVGIVIHSSTIYHAVTFQGYDDKGSLQITDSDRDAPGGDLNTYAYDTSGATNWFLKDYVTGGIAVDYFATLRRIPEPETVLLVLAALAALRATSLKRPCAKGGATTS
jgi:hypothetical protein